MQRTNFVLAFVRAIPEPVATSVVHLLVTFVAPEDIPEFDHVIIDIASLLPRAGQQSLWHVVHTDSSSIFGCARRLRKHLNQVDQWQLALKYDRFFQAVFAAACNPLFWKTLQVCHPSAHAALHTFCLSCIHARPRKRKLLFG